MEINCSYVAKEPSSRKEGYCDYYHCKRTLEFSFDEDYWSNLSSKEKDKILIKELSKYHWRILTPNWNINPRLNRGYSEKYSTTIKMYD